MSTRLPITRKTQTQVHRGSSRFYSPPIPTDDEQPFYSLSSAVVVAVEGGENKKVQVVASRLSMAIGIVPFVVDNSGFAVPAARGVDYDIIRADGTIVVGDYFIIPVGQLRGELFVRAYLDPDLEGEQVTRIRIVESNGQASLTGQLAGVIETEVRIQDPSSTTISMSQATYTVAEPAIGSTADIEVGVTLSVSAPSAITIPLSIAGGTATPGVNFQMVDSSITISTGQNSGSATLRILRDGVYTGNRTVIVQLEAPTGPATLVVNATTATVNILDQDPATDYALRFSTQHSGVITVQEGGPTVKARVEFVDGLPNTVQTSVDWELVATGGSGVLIGSHITTSTTNPLVIPAGQTFGEISLSAPANATVDGDRTFELRITGATGGQAYVGEDDTLLGTLVDTTVPRPRAFWVDDTLNLFEGSTGFKRIYLTEPAPNPITVELSVTGVATLSDFTIGATTILAGENNVNVSFQAILDALPEGTEAAQVAIVPRSDYDAGGIPTLFVTIQDQISGSSTLEFTPAPAGEPTLIDCVTGLGPFDRDFPPSMTINGMLADVFPVDNGRGSNTSHAWQCVAYMDAPSGQATLAPSAGGESYGPGYRTDDISQHRFELQTRIAGATQFAPHTVTIGEAVAVHTNRSGHYILDETYILRPRLAAEAGTKHEYCGVLVLTVVRTPAAITIHGVLRNDAYRANATLGHFQNAPLRNEINAKISFDSLRCFPPANMRVKFDPVSQRVTTGSTNIISTPSGGKAHRLPPQRQFHWDHVLVTATATEVVTDAVANTYMDGTGVAVAVDGPYAFDARHWFGTSLARIPRWEADYHFAEFPGLTGMEASKARAASLLQQATNSCRGSSTNRMDPVIWSYSGETGGDNIGWFEPAIFADSYNGGGQLIFFRMGWDFQPEAFRAMQIWARHVAQCNPTHMLNIETGWPMDLETLAATNTVPPGEVGKIPWMNGPLGSDTWIRSPWFVPKVARPGQGDPGTTTWNLYSQRPTGRLWNAQHPAGYAEGPRVESVGGGLEDQDADISNSTSANNWGRTDMDHFLRENEIFATLAACRNLSWAKHRLLDDATHITHVWPHLPLQGVNTYQDGRVGYFHNNFNLNEVVPHLIFGTIGADTGYYQGGYTNKRPFDSPTRTLQRGAGHSTGAVAHAEAFCPDGNAAITAIRNWSQKWIDTCNIITTTWGGGDRESGYYRQGTIKPYTPFEQHFPWRLESVTPGTVYSWQNAWPLSYTGAQGWHAAFFARRMFDLYQAKFNPANYGPFRKYGSTFALEVWRNRPAGKLPCGYLLYSAGAQGPRDQLATDGTAHPLPYELIPGSPATSTLFRYIGESWGPTYAATLQALEQDGQIAERDEMLGYLNLQYGLAQSATVDALLSAVVANARLDSGTNHPGAFRTAMHADLIGYLQGIR